MKLIPALRLTFFSLILSLSGSLAQAAEPMIQVELLLFRQAEAPLIASQPPSPNWAGNAKLLTERNEVPLSLTESAARLKPEQGYQILLHKAWRQTMSGSGTSMAVKVGQSQFEFAPIQGRFQLSLGDQISVDTDVWVNQFDEQGRVSASEHIDQKFKIRANEVRYLDHGSLGALIKITTI